jgi:glucosamine 6-phosphate synthetase-like amidotransferase/phosphosugar isomerase protein
LCGISGIIYHNPLEYRNLGSDLLALIQPLETRGPDSCGLALYREQPTADRMTLLLGGYAPLQEVQHWLTQFATVEQSQFVTNGQRIFLQCDPMQLDLVDLRDRLMQRFPNLHWISAGQSLEIYKHVGSIEGLDQIYDIRQITGSHAIGHTRMATESAIDLERCHPFTTGSDLAIVHNGQISNYFRLRFQLERLGVRFVTDNDSEILVHYIHSYLQQGKPLEAVLHQLLKDVDGSYTFLVATRDQVGLVRDRMATKPAVIYEVPTLVAIASEYRALLNLPNFDSTATIREPDAGEVNIWSTAAIRELQPVGREVA